ncbi:9951_t:CDS:2 [Dentiscutata erythropus]|uniref:9951_t:CDS:1 n=1 Tax=Dentiscutata erythropus TaxID=1348616 RepID=A0A9N8Z9H1_9GLOM|nr:9951_t:CDS:2 [Dentiscutata erythropus]
MNSQEYQYLLKYLSQQHLPTIDNKTKRRLELKKGIEYAEENLLTRLFYLVDEFPKEKESTKARIKVNQQKQKRYHDQKVKIIITHEIGDKVLMYNAIKDKNYSGKLEPNWKGPYYIHTVPHPGVYKLRTLDGKVLKVPINGSLLKRYNDRNFWKMSQYYSDLIRIGSYTVRQIDRPYNLNQTWETSAQHVYQQLQTAMNSHNRIMTLVYCYYLGELVQFSVTPKAKWKEFVQDNQIPNHYYLYRGVTRIYQLFEKNPNQMYCTITLTYNAISRMKVSTFNELLIYNNDLNDLVDNLELS